MTSDVLLSISGIQTGADMDNHDMNGNEPVEVITPAKYYFKNGKHYLLYDEADPDEHAVTHTTLKFADRYLSVFRRGETQTQLLIESGRHNVTYYATPFGSLHIVIDGRQVNVDETEDLISARAFYGLEINYEHIADCEVRIRVTSRDAAILT